MGCRQPCPAQPNVPLKAWNDWKVRSLNLVERSNAAPSTNVRNASYSRRNRKTDLCYGPKCARRWRQLQTQRSRAPAQPFFNQTLKSRPKRIRQKVLTPSILLKKTSHNQAPMGIPRDAECPRNAIEMLPCGRQDD